MAGSALRDRGLVAGHPGASRPALLVWSDAAVLLAAMFAGLAAAGTAVDGDAIADELQGDNWLSTGRTYAEHHYSPLAQITRDNVERLGLAWALDLPGERTLEAPPLAVDGVLYFSGAYGKTYAVDVHNGRPLWEFDPDLAHHSPEKLRLVMGAHRGVAYWQGKVYVGVVDGRLIALDAKTGKTVWTVQSFDAPTARKAISGAPRVFDGKVIIGHGGGDYGTRGYVTAYDANTGQQRWRFYTVPGDPHKGFENDTMARAARTWSGRWWRWGGGGAVWDNITYDPEFNRIYIGTGNGIPWNVNVRSAGHGDNWFICSIVALDARTGRYAWHYQTTPGDRWDFDATQNMVLADLTINGHARKVLMQANKNGFFYELDRATGRLIGAEPFATVTWATGIDRSTGRPIEAPHARYENGPVLIRPSAAGAHTFPPMSFNPGTGLVYIPTIKQGLRIGPPKNQDDIENFDNPRRRYLPVVGVNADFPAIDADDGTTSLLAWDPVTQQKRWEVHYPDSFWNGGTMTTAGDLVFQGTGRGKFLAYDAKSGATLWTFDTGLGIVAAPITYEVEGTQFVALLVGYGGSAGNGGRMFDTGWRFNEQPRRLLAFALDRQGALPATAPPRFTVHAVDDPAVQIDTEQAAEGSRLYHFSCSSCHGNLLQSTGSIAPDLRESTLALNWPSFRSVLHDGLLASAGMPKYDEFSEEDLRSIYLYVRQGSREARSGAPHE
jgi:quinohemoprotein ethanol dehydrogenase